MMEMFFQVLPSVMMAPAMEKSRVSKIPASPIDSKARAVSILQPERKKIIGTNRRYHWHTRTSPFHEKQRDEIRLRFHISLNFYHSQGIFSRRQVDNIFA